MSIAAMSCVAAHKGEKDPILNSSVGDDFMMWKRN